MTTMKPYRVPGSHIIHPLLVVALIGRSCLAEDFSPVVGVALTGIGAFSYERGVGFGVESTLALPLFNASVEAVQFSDKYEGHDFVLSAYAGGGFFNVAMLQIGLDNDGIAGRLHGELGLRSLLAGGWGLGFVEDSKRTAAFVRDDLALSYSAGINDAGFFSSIGLGVIF